MTKESEAIVFVGYTLTITAYLFLAPILVAFAIQYRPDPMSAYVPIFFYGMGWLGLWAQSLKKIMKEDQKK